MIEQLSNAITFRAHFLASAVSATGLTVTVDVYNPAGTQIVTGGTGSELGSSGVYYYVLASGSVTTEGEYVAVFKTTGTADQKHVAALWVVGRAGVENLDGTITSRAAASIFAGITLLAHWLGAMAGKQVPNSTALAEIRASGAGSGTFDATTDSNEAIRDTAPMGTAMRGTDSAALASVCTEGRLANLNATVGSRSSHSAADVWAVSVRSLSTFGTLVADIVAAVWAAAVRTLTAGAGLGAYPITVTVTDGTNPLQNAIVRVSEGASAYTATTDASGQATFALDAATYAVSVTKAGYSFTPTTRTVTGAEAGTLTSALAMAAVTIPSAPADPALCVVYGYIEGLSNVAAAGVVVTFTLLPATAARSERILEQTKAAATSDANGFLSLSLQRNDQITPAGSRYRVECEALKLRKEITLKAATFDLLDIV